MGIEYLPHADVISAGDTFIKDHSCPERERAMAESPRIIWPDGRVGGLAPGFSDAWMSSGPYIDRVIRCHACGHTWRATNKPKRFSTKSAARKLVAALWHAGFNMTTTERKLVERRFIKIINPTKG